MCCDCDDLGTLAFPSAAVAAEAPVPRVRRASVHMEAMGLWRPSLDTVGWTSYGPVCSMNCYSIVLLSGPLLML